MNIEDDEVTNPTENRPFEDVLATRLSRRHAIVGGGAAFTAAFVGLPAAAEASGIGSAPLGDRGRRGGGRGGHGRRDDNIDFTPVPNAEAVGPEPTIAPEYTYDVLIPWGTAIQPGGPAFSWPPTSAADAEVQIGIGHDGMHFFPLGRSSGVLCINHEFGTTPHVLGKDLPESLDEVRIMQAVHGVSVVTLRRRRSTWSVSRSRRNRRITVNTPVEISGPVADSALLVTAAGNGPAGTLNNCSNGATPWGTYLTCEENFNGYFGATGDWTPTPGQERYGFSADGFGYGWHNFDARFDLSNPDYANEDNRFGWIVEIDPFRSNQAPVKRTALGRLKHEGIAITEGKGRRIVGYMGDDQRFDYIYKFVSSGNWRRMRAQGKSPLDEGQLYCARFNDDGSGEWLELTIDNPDLAAVFADQAELLTYTRMAADILGATPMDRPEWTTVAPNGDVYCTLTNNTRRTEADAANPQAPNPHGHIIRWTDSDDHVGETFDWEIVLLASDTHGTDHAFSSPDGLWADPDGRLFIETDGSQPEGMNDQLLVANASGTVKRLFAGVTDCEVTGIATTADRRTGFVNIQHPGNGDPTATNFPAPTDGTTVPRDATIVVRRTDGGVFGS